MEYRVLLLPNISAMPLKSLEIIRDFVSDGGVVVALERVPEASVGFDDYERRDREVRAIVEEMFDTPRWRVNETAPRDYDNGRTYQVRFVIDRSNVLERHSNPTDPFLDVLRRHIKPDVDIDYMRMGMRNNEGLAFVHRRLLGREIYFLTNLQDRPLDMPISFRVSGMVPSEWDPYCGRIERIWEYDDRGDLTWIPIRLEPFGSKIIVFDEVEEDGVPVVDSTFDAILNSKSSKLEAKTGTNGHHRAVLGDGTAIRTVVGGIPQPYRIDGNWELVLEGIDFPRHSTTMEKLTSWTEVKETRHFSGTGSYNITFDLPGDYISEDLDLELDLGTVGNIAEVWVNGKSAGVRWMRGQFLDTTDLVSEGSNSLEVEVTNTLINRVSGLKELPQVPEDLRERYGKDKMMDKSPSWRLIGYGPLPNSGLIGPVQILASKRVIMRKGS
jgi:hypothetical protein